MADGMPQLVVAFAMPLVKLLLAARTLNSSTMTYTPAIASAHGKHHKAALIKADIWIGELAHVNAQRIHPGTLLAMSLPSLCGTLRLVNVFVMHRTHPDAPQIKHLTVT